MSSNQFISVRETAQILGVSEKKVMDLIEERKLQAYRIADKFLRLKKTDIQQMRNVGEIKPEAAVHMYSPSEKLMDFFYFNDFYILSFLMIGFLVYIIIYT